MDLTVSSGPKKGGERDEYLCNFFQNGNGYLEGVKELEQGILSNTTRKPLEFTNFLTFLLADELSSLRSRLPWLTSTCRPFSDFCSVCSYLPEVVERLESTTEDT